MRGLESSVTRTESTTLSSDFLMSGLIDSALTSTIRRGRGLEREEQDGLLLMKLAALSIIAKSKEEAREYNG